MPSADHQHAPEIHALRRQHVDDLPWSALEVCRLHRLGDAAVGGRVQRLAGLQQVAAFTGHDCHNVAAGGGHKTDVHDFPWGTFAGYRPLQPRSTEW
jgi:hypothetical protein